MKRRAWTLKEDAYLHQNYKARGAKRCAADLGRTVGGTMSKAAKLGLQVSQASLIVRFTPQMDDVIRRAYQNHTPGSVIRAAKALTLTPQQISRRAGTLGLRARPSAATAWLACEITYIEENKHKSRARMSREMRKRGWSRTPAAIQKQICAQGFSGPSDEHMSLMRLGYCLGIAGSVITRWIVKGLLVAERAGWNRGPAQGGDAYRVAEAEIARFIVQNAGLIDMRKVDGPWLIDLLARLGSRGLTEARDKGQRIVALKLADPDRSNTEIAAMVDSTPASVGVILARHRASGQRTAA
ncbi:hypothetical protein [Methylobacterium sp. J-092]|uniref:hypothetical protein n=1 Tax=Methylobacterium sp. J-092 TaxID=2836667 RepID=UPI001FB99652|nr:hypothetical protein [Methylobacterium sp. J-092]MCJ2009766.1 hypothetical protein [Methylobacterium sp. J-092]